MVTGGRGGPWVARKSSTRASLESVAGSGDVAWVVGAGGTILKSADAGATWQAQSSGGTARLRGVWAISTTAAIVVGSGGTILRTVDGGATWSPIASGTQRPLRRVAGANDGELYAVGEGGTILRSADGGASWTVEPCDVDAAVLAIAGGGRAPLLAVGQASGAGGASLLFRRDKGRWRSTETSAPAAWLLAAPGGQWWVGAFNRIARSTDGGATFVEAVAPSGTGRIMAGAVTAEGDAFVVGGGYDARRSTVVPFAYAIPPGGFVAQRPRLPARHAGPLTPPPAQQLPLELVPQIGHTAAIRTLAVGGRRALSAGGDGALKLWDLESGLLLRDLDLRATAASLSADGSRALVAARDPDRLLLLDLATFATLRALPVAASDVALSPDARTAALSVGGTTLVVDLDSGSMLRALPLSTSTLRFSPDGKRLLVGNTLWTGRAERVVARLPLRAVSGASFSPDGGRLLLLAQGKSLGDKRMSLWDVGGGHRLPPLDDRDVAAETAVLLDGARVVLGDRSGNLRAIDLATGAPRGGDDAGSPPRRAHLSTITGLALFHEGRRLVSSGEDAALLVSDLATLTPISTIYAHAPGTAAAFSPDGKQLATGGAGVALWDLSQGVVVRSFEVGEPLVTAVGFSADGRRLLAAGSHYTLGAFATDTGATLLSRPAAPLVEDRVAFSRDGARAVLARDGDRYARMGMLEIVELAGSEAPGSNDAKPRRLAVAQRDMLRAAFLPDGDRLLASASDGHVELWSRTGGQRLGTLDTACRTRVLAVSLDGGRALGVCDGRTLRLYDLAGTAPPRDFALPAPGGVAFSVDGAAAWVGDGRDLVELELASGRERRRLRGHRAAIRVVEASADGGLVVSGSDDGTYRLWRTSSGSSVTLLAAAGEWLMYDDEARFEASRRGTGLVAAVRGLSGARIDQLAVANNRPDLLLERVGLGSPPLLDHLRAVWRRRLARAGLDEGRLARGFDDLPEATVGAVTVEGRRATVAFTLAARRAPLARYDVFVNGVPVRSAKVSGRGARGRETVELVPGANRIEVSAFDESGAESLRALEVADWRGEAKGDLWFIGFGVSRYRESRLDLGFPHKDVLDLGDTLREASGPFARTHVATFVNEQATAASIARAKQLLAEARLDDTVVVLVAGHGMHARDAAANYYFLTHEADPARLADTAADFAQIEGLLEGIAPRRKLLLLDTCESGERDEAQADTTAPDPALRARAAVPLAGTTRSAARPWLLERGRFLYNDLARRSGAVVIASSRGSEYSWELASLGNGVFTKQVLTALVTDAADESHDGALSIAELTAFVRRQVATVTRDRQHPDLERDNRDAAFTLPLVKSAEPILTRPDPLPR